MTTPLVSVIVPCKNSAGSLSALLTSLTLSTYKNFEIVVNDDIVSSDNTLKVVSRFTKKLTITYIKQNVSMAQGRKTAAAVAKGNILIHIDSDMQISKGLIAECVDKLKDFDALIIPEISIASSYWAKVKAIEKQCYQGIREIESARAINKSVYMKLGGHNESMVFSEDKDLDLRIQMGSYKIGKTENYITHDEGNIKLLNTLRKKLGYSNTADLFALSHPESYKWQTNPFRRYYIFLKKYKLIFVHPILYISLFYMKTLEFFFSWIGVVKAKENGLNKILVAKKTISNWWIIIVDKLGLRKTCEYQARTTGQHFICRTKSTDINEMVVCLSGQEYDSQYLRIKNGAVVLDVGANIGGFSLYFDFVNSKQKYIGYAIEPFKQNIELLRENLISNKIQNFEICSIGLSDKNGTSYLDTNLGYDAIHLTSKKTHTKITTQTLESFCKERHINKIDLLKMDIEGAEFSIIEKSNKFISKNVKRIIMEYHLDFEPNGLEVVTNAFKKNFYIRRMHSKPSKGVLLLVNKAMIN